MKTISGSSFLVGSILFLCSMGCMASSLDNAFENILPLCEQYFLPNSMAHAPGTDINAVLRSTKAEIRKRSVVFRSRMGRDYLAKRLSAEEDDVAKVCIGLLQDAAARPSATEPAR